MVEDVIIREGHFEVKTERMRKVKQQFITQFEIKMIIKARNEYLEWMHNNFSKMILKPPNKNYLDPKS
ncbi:hypothetical protein B9Q03_07495 [Candidatus Marsarchaeota G2 archaeon OSP_D]|uniref:Uncharacterized protein n=2 Tax=Candidatus Marsarchaeota group 2 TaxID=2203771 RepID=A0A2R6B4G1_9ARCH|nr:MAG: hypothetical protein B9Q03_07495 [Candidatus Marsarchaeota G2 archaeon OSP_D]PSN93472.1 MAG: hypothetical protein B9Q09_05805 [Candidatus Marsarchaeota G2 archaeon ECH_B_SAG-C16]